MVIERKVYLDKLVNRMNNGLIKVITGIRRSGKSFLLFNIFKEYLINNGTDEKHIVCIQLDLLENKKYRNAEFALTYIKSLIQDEKQYYVLLDEIQMIENFEDLLNSLLHINNIDTYVTGSNSKFLSSDILTNFRGRGDEIHVHPLSFAEYMQVFEGNKYEGWAEYVTYGGLPLITSMKTDEQKINYLTQLFKETYLKDITERHRIDKPHELNDLINILASNIGALSNPAKIHNTFKSKLNSNISFNTIKTYIEYLKNAFIIDEAYRYDVKGRKYIGTPMKYYFEDIGLRNARLGFRQIEETHIMENIIYNELKIQGYKVDVGVINKTITANHKQQRKQLEIDFIATLGNKKHYIQSALTLPTAEKINQEKASLLSINDSFKKIILVKDIIKTRIDEQGIVIMNVYDFLLSPNILF